MFEKQAKNTKKLPNKGYKNAIILILRALK